MLKIVEFLAIQGATFYLFLCPIFVLSLVYSIKKMNGNKDGNERWEVRALLFSCIVSLILLISPIMYTFMT